ncbi:hypothetical protein Tco_1415791 [Tanacetum coccineum]
MVYVVNGVLASGVDMVLDKDFAGFALQEIKIHPLMLLIQTFSMIFQMFSTTLQNPSMNHTHVNYVGTTLIMVTIVHQGYRLSMSMNQATIIITHKIHRYSIDHQPQIIQEEQQWISEKLIKSHNELFKSVRSMFEEFRQREHAANLSAHIPEPSRHFNFTCYDDDDYEESTIPLNEIVFQIPLSIAITPLLPTLEPEDSVIMGDEDLSTILEKESDEFVKSSVENLVPIPNESEDTSGSDSECDLPSCDDFSPINIPEEISVIEDIKCKASYDSNLDEPTLLVTPFSAFNEDECFDPGGDVDEIELLLHRDLSTLKISVASILEGFTDETPLVENDDLFDLESKENE